MRAERPAAPLCLNRQHQVLLRRQGGCACGRRSPADLDVLLGEPADGYRGGPLAGGHVLGPGGQGVAVSRVGIEKALESRGLLISGWWDLGLGVKFSAWPLSLIGPKS